MNYIKHYLLAVVCVLMTLASCNDDWDDRTSLQDKNLSNTDLWEELSTQNNLSIFKEILTTAGYAQYMSADYDISVLTIFAPTNAAFEQAFNDGTIVREEFMADVDALKAFLSRHIANTMQMAELSLDPYRVKMWDGRRLYYAPKPDASGKMYVDEDIALSQYNIMCKNGVIHTIESIIPDRPNVWEAAKSLLTSNGDPLQLLNAISRFDYRMMDSASKITGYVNDLPTYDTIWINSNRILDFKDIANEDTLYTYVVLKDAGYIPLAAKYGKIYKRNLTSESDSLTIINLNLDLIFPGVLNLASAGEYESVTGVKVKLDPQNIISIQRASNGYVYELNTASITFKNNKVKDVIVEGENTDYRDTQFESIQDYTTTLVDGDTFLRGKLWKVKYRTWASNNRVLNLGGFFRESGNNWDPISIGGDRPRHYTHYTKIRPQVFSVPYSMYWRMGNDYVKSGMEREMIAQRIYISGPEAPYEVAMRSTTFRIDYNDVYTQEFADTAAKFPANTATGYRIQIDRPTFAFYASIQDSINHNRWYNNQYVQDTVYAKNVKEWLLENDRYKAYGFKMTADSEVPRVGIDSIYPVLINPDTLNTAPALLTSGKFLIDYYAAYMASDTVKANKAHLKALSLLPKRAGLPKALYLITRPDEDGVEHPYRYYAGGFPDPNTNWTNTDFCALTKYPNHEQQLMLTYAYNNGTYEEWKTNDDPAYNRHLFTSYGEATLLMTRNFTGVGTSMTFQQNAFVTLDYIRLEPCLDDIDIEE